MPDFIDGIFNYCDRWCERCPLTARCRQFAMEQEINRGGDLQNAEFWASLELHVPDNSEFEALLAEAAEEAEEDEDWSSSLDDPFDAEENEFDRAQNNPLSQAAFAYAHAVRDWIATAGLRDRERPAGIPATLNRDEALDVIEWYSLQIGVKLTRAASGQLAVDDAAAYAGADPETAEEEELDALWEDDITSGLRDAERSDRDGSAKVALIGIERSLGALTILRRELPADEPSIRKLLQQLARLRIEIDRLFPGARTFVRPGFDDE
jgi:hypothetical protein